MNHLRKPLVFVSIVSFVVSSLFLIQHNKINSNFGMEQLYFFNFANRTRKHILYWTTMFGNKNFNLGLGSKIFENCPYQNCYTTYNRQLLAVEDFDAILFHAIEYKEKVHGKPKKRSPHQVYVISNQESPDNTPLLFPFENFYNWTMTYRLDSDIFRPYGYVEKKKTDYELPSVESIERRPKKIAWFVSNCHTSSERHRIYEKLEDFFPIDVYGFCGSLVCSRDKKDDCYEMLENNYKFYLSFENSICDGYVTEKLYNILQRNIVPIVYSGADMTKVAPPHSVINVMDFDSIDTLVKYIKFLDSHPTEYLAYFAWKKTHIINTSSHLTLCTLCQKLNERKESKVYENINSWWFGTNFTKCIKNAFLKTFLQQ